MSRLAVVCGGSRGIGKAVSRLLAQRGCRLAVVSRSKDAARSTVASLQGGKCRTDISLFIASSFDLFPAVPTESLHSCCTTPMS